MQNPSPDFDVILFRERLMDTIRWCRYETQSSDANANNLWSLGDPLLIKSNPERFLTHLPSGPLAEYANSIFVRRSQLVIPLPPLVNILDAALMGGRLLAFFPGDTLSDGYAEQVSHGFFDADNCPPCDTLVYFYGDAHNTHLVSWVPPEYLHDAEEGIAVNPEECLRWINKSDDSQIYDYSFPYIPKLLSAGFL